MEHLPLPDDIDALPGATVLDSAGTLVGAVVDVFRPGSDGVAWATVSPDAERGDAVFVPLVGATRNASGELVLHVTAEQVQGAPRPTTVDDLSGDDELELRRWYDGEGYAGVPTAEDVEGVVGDALHPAVLARDEAEGTGAVV